MEQEIVKFTVGVEDFDCMLITDVSTARDLVRFKR